MGRVAGSEPGLGAIANLNDAVAAVAADLLSASASLDGRLDLVEAQAYDFLRFGAESITSGLSGRFMNAVGIATNPPGAVSVYVPVTVAGNLRAIHYYIAATFATGSVVATPRRSPVGGGAAADLTSQALTIVNGSSPFARVAVTPIAVAVGDAMAFRVTSSFAGGSVGFFAAALEIGA
jgi:hypothetical protein